MAVAVTLEGYLGGVWTDITVDRAHSQGPMNLSGGIQGVGPDALVASPGTWTFELDNSSHCSGGVAGYYSPNHASKRANWGIGTKVRWGITIGANPKYYKFVGWVQQITPITGLYGDQVVEVVATDWMDQAASVLATGATIQASKRGDQLLGTLAALMTNAPEGTSYDVGVDTYLSALDDLDPSSSRVLQGIINVARSGFDRIYLKGDTTTGGVLRFESHSIRRTFTTDAFTLSDTPPGGQPCLALTGLATGKRRDSLINEIKLTIHPRKTDAANVVLYSQNVSSVSTDAIPAAGGTLTIYANYADPSQLAQRVAGTSMVVPVATTDYTANSAANGSGTDLTASVALAVTFFASTAKIVITNSHATLAAYMTKLQLRGLGVYTYQDVTLTAVDSVAQAANGQIALAIEMPYQSSQLQTQIAASYFNSLYPSSAWTDIDAVVVFCHTGDETTLATLIQAEVSTAFSITETMAGFMGYPLWLNSWSLDVDERDLFTFTFTVEPRDPNQYWSLGVAGLSELGLTTYLAPF